MAILDQFEGPIKSPRQSHFGAPGVAASITAGFHELRVTMLGCDPEELKKGDKHTLQHMHANKRLHTHTHTHTDGAHLRECKAWVGPGCGPAVLCRPSGAGPHRLAGPLATGAAPR